MPEPYSRPTLSAHVVDADHVALAFQTAMRLR
jgi:hypothetical protein